jgi:hypothetical protein
LTVILENNPQVGRYRTRKRIDRSAELLSSHHTRPLRSLRDILSEQGRIYRSVVNGVISSAEGARLVYMLREIRGTQESIVSAEIAAAEVAQANTEATPVRIDIVTVPEGHFLQPDGSFRPMPEEMRQIEHTPQVEMQMTPAEEAAIDSVKSEINMLAKKLGIELVV